ncbi:uncharacterized protein LODBEIA_P59800 [Lodderomyces beijingensis]|uniref:Mitochondrial acidic protein MAM33 n=1 Tax=Lodderomyces beijingensis TaxID=1775926 RepID=A0ABP0ZUE8_9ASCO
MSRVLSSALRANVSKRLALQASKQPRTTILSTAAKTFATSAIRSLNQSSIRFNHTTPEAALDQVLKAESKLIETAPNELESTYQDFLSSNGFKLISKPGAANVELVKTDADTGNVIHVYFDIDEVTDIPTEDLEGLENGDLEGEIDSLDSMLCNIKVLVENGKNNSGLFLSLFLQNTESSFMIDYVNVHNDVQKFLKTIQEQNEFVDKFNYQGPKFSDLDESLQTEFENYLVAKGIDSDLADFIVAYSDVKEEDEYRNWIKDVSKFLN